MILLRLDQEARHYNLGLKLYYEMADEILKKYCFSKQTLFL